MTILAECASKFFEASADDFWSGFAEIDLFRMGPELMSLVTFGSDQMRRALYEFGLRQIWEAYQGSRSSIYAQIAALDDKFENEKDLNSDDHLYQEWLINQHEKLESALKLIREAFAIILRHFLGDGGKWLGEGRQI